MEDSAIHNSSRYTGGVERSTHHDEEEEEEEDVPEESGWTVYFDDFFSNNNREIVLQNDASSSSCFSGSPSLVSDAASIAAWNKLSSNVVGQSPIVRTDKVTSKKLRLLKKKKGIVRGGGGGVMDIEDALEDTASSPVNSPKVSSDHHVMKQFDHLMNTPRKIDDHTSCSSSSLRNKQLGGGGGGGVSAGHFSEMQTDERNAHHHHFLGGGAGGGGQGFNGRENECTELKKKGLCLVPMSMLVNYFG